MFESLRPSATGRNVVIALAVFILALIAINVGASFFYNANGGYGILDFGGGANLFDDRGGYTPERAYVLIAHYGEAGIERYYLLLATDLLFPATLGLFALLAILGAMMNIAPNKGWPYGLALLPITYVLADWLENAGILTMLLAYPTELYWLAEATDTVRGIKSSLAGLSLLTAGATWGIVLGRRSDAAATT